jgi:DNA-binding IclR family transcriptional regulator
MADGGGPARAEGGTVGKALGVLDQVARFGRPVRFAELLADSPHPKPSLYRFLQTLTGQGMLIHDPETQTYALGVRLVRLAHAAWRQSSLAPVARPHLDRLAAETGETVHLAQLDAAHVLYVDKRRAAQPVEMFSDAGKVGPAYCTGVGKAMLAFLDEAAREQALAQQSWFAFTPSTITTAEAMRRELAAIRACGHALDREEHEPGIRCVAAPVLSRGGRALGALSVTSGGGRRSLAEMEALAPAVRAAAAAIARDFETWRFPDAGTDHNREGDAPCRE